MTAATALLIERLDLANSALERILADAQELLAEDELNAIAVAADKTAAAYQRICDLAYPREAS